jgi:predicted nucleic acid-binding protein
VIHLDANYLIRGNQNGTREDADLIRWLAADEILAASSIAWMEFVSGPVSDAVIESIRHAIGDRIVAFTEAEAELAAQLFNVTGRRRSMRYDCMIAAASINAGAELATANQVDFSQFVPHGLKHAMRS